MTDNSSGKVKEWETVGTDSKGNEREYVYTNICLIEHGDPVFAIVWARNCPLCGNLHFAVTDSNVLNFDGGCPVHRTATYGWGRVMFVNKYQYNLVAQAMATQEVLGGLADLKRQLEAQVAVQEEAQRGAKQSLLRRLGGEKEKAK